jgi:transcriptional regulator with XRE-family HTH domain
MKREKRVVRQSMAAAQAQASAYIENLQPPIGSCRQTLLLDFIRLPSGKYFCTPLFCASFYILCWSLRMPDGKSPDIIDAHLGERVRIQRLMIHMSQQTLAAGLGLTFQQIQKYERGTNRISASRLQKISEILGVSVSSLFEGLPGQNNRAGTPRYFVELMGTVQGQRLVAAFARLTDKDVRSYIVRLVESLVRPSPPAHQPSRKKPARAQRGK